MSTIHYVRVNRQPLGPHPWPTNLLIWFYFQKNHSFDVIGESSDYQGPHEALHLLAK